MTETHNKTYTIVLTGPESSGKTALATSLAKVLGCPLIPEYAREYLRTRKQSYKLDDLVNIAEIQHEHVATAYDKGSQFIVVDTYMWVMMIWAKIRFGQIPDRIKEMSYTTPVDLFILCTPDLPWEDDPLREHPDHGDRLFEIYQNTLKSAEENYITVTGNLEERIQKVLEFLDFGEEKG